MLNYSYSYYVQCNHIANIATWTYKVNNTITTKKKTESKLELTNAYLLWQS